MNQPGEAHFTRSAVACLIEKAVHRLRSGCDVTPQYSAAIRDVTTGVLAWDMWGRLGWRDTLRRYRRTTIGPFWSTASVGIFVVMLTGVWSRVWNQDALAYLPYLTSGMISWMMISAILTEGNIALVVSESLIKQLRVSYTVLVCTVICRNVVTFGHNMLIMVPVCIYVGLAPNWATLLFVPGFFLFCVNAMWIVLVLALACARYRDVAPLIGSLLQISMFITPVLWNPGQLEGKMGLIIQLNPLYHLLELVRAPLLGHSPSAQTWLFALAGAAAGWTGAIFLFSRFRRRIPYWI
jgi:ABC-type polysaccharide/polyol phosphate export permease